MFDPEAFGAAMGDLIREAVEPLQKEIGELKAQLAALPKTAGKDGADGKNGRDGIDGKDGERGEKGADGVGLAGAMIDRDDVLQVTLTNGEVKSLGKVVGRDGKDGADGKDGISFETFELEYIAETHEMCVKASAGGRTKELRYPAGGIRHGGYWRDGVKAVAGQTWTIGGTTYVAKNATSAKPAPMHEDWEIFARGGRDGERGPKGSDGSPPAPVKLKD